MMYRLAILCGALPLMTGISVFLLWVLFRWDWLMVAGVYVIIVGAVLFPIGAFCLARSHVLSLSDVGMSYRRRFWQTLAGACLLCINFPAAAAIILAVEYVQSLYTVIVHNQSDAAVEEVIVFGGGVRVEYGTIEPEERVRRSFHIQSQGVLMCSAVQHGKPLEATVDGYVTNGLGGRRLVRMTPEGTLEAIDARSD